MADTVGKLVLEVLKKDCGAYTCPYRAGDSQVKQDQFSTRIDEKLKHRVADGNEVRALEKRVDVLEKALRNCLALASSRKKTAEVEMIKQALNKKKKDK